MPQQRFTDHVVLHLLFILQKFGPAADSVASAKLRGSYVVERAYCLFRMGRLKEALALCQAATAAQRTDALLHLEGQVRSNFTYRYITYKHHMLHHSNITLRSLPQVASLCINDTASFTSRDIHYTMQF
jgi:hypothetical protein